MNNIVLIGYRGTGKSVVATQLAEKLSTISYSMDEVIVERAKATIPEIVQRYGWDRFRDIESEVVADLSGESGVILDCGGGVILREENVLNLKSNGTVFLLTATPKTIIDRIKDDTNRPSLKEGKTFLEEVTEVLAERQPLYQAAAHFTIDTETQDPSQIAERIIECLRQNRLPTEKSHPRPNS